MTKEEEDITALVNRSKKKGPMVEWITVQGEKKAMITSYKGGGNPLPTPQEPCGKTEGRRTTISVIFYKGDNSKTNSK